MMNVFVNFLSAVSRFTFTQQIICYKVV